MNPVWSLFPKAYRDIETKRLVALVKEVGLDTTNVIVRKGHPVNEENLADSLPRFVKDAETEGIRVTCASTMLTPDEITCAESPLKVFADCGIHEFRMGWFPKAEDDIRGAIHLAKADMDRVVEACKKYHVRAIYQVHHNTLVSSPSAAYNLVRGLPAEWVGVELDPGNQSFQGFELWHYSVGLLGEYCAWVGVKDTITWQDSAHVTDADKGWRRNFAPLSEGVTNWQKLVDALLQNSFDGTLVFMPFYDEEDDSLRTTKLKAEVTYLRDVFARQTGQ